MLEKYFDNDLEDDILMAITSSGYFNNLIGIEYIRHFNRMTRNRTKGKYRMLIFDSHGSHIV